MNQVDDIFLVDSDVHQFSGSYDDFSEFSDFINPIDLRLELEKRDITSSSSNGIMSYSVAISQSRMSAIRSFAEKKQNKMPGSKGAYFNALKGAMGETSVVIVLRAFLEIFGKDPSIAKVNLRIHPGNDGGKDHLVAGLSMNSKFSNNFKSGMFFSERDLKNKGDSDYYILVNGEGVKDHILDNPNSGSHIVTVSGVIQSKDLSTDRMSMIINKFGKERWVVEKNSLDSVNVLIRDILNRIS